jgi:uncharacterized membrane protein YhiD involved in acid resistance
MQAIFLPIGVGIAIGLLLYLLAAVGLIFVPFVTIASHYTPQGRVRWEAKKRAYREWTALPRGSAERRAALQRYKSV